MADISGRSPREVIEMMQKADPTGRELMGVVFACKQRVQDDPDFAEGMVEIGGLTLLLELIPNAGGSVGYLLDTVCGLVLYSNGLQQLSEQPDIVDRIWRMVHQKDSQGDVAIRIARPAVMILILTVKFLDKLQDPEDSSWINAGDDIPTKRRKIDAGRAAVHQAAKRLSEKEGYDYYSTLCSLIDTSEIQLLTNVTCLLNILLEKTKNESLFKAKKLLFRWQQCGLLDKVQSVSSEDIILKNMLDAFKKTRMQIKIPECWPSALKNQTVFDKEKATYDSLNKEIFLFQQQQSKIREARLSVQKYQDTLYAASLQLGISPLYHPTKRFAEGGGMNIPSTPLPPSARPIQLNYNTDQTELKTVRTQLFTGFKVATDFRTNVESIVGPVATEAPVAPPPQQRSGLGLDDDDDDEDSDSDGIGPPEDSDSDSMEPPSDDDSLPPPSDSSDDMGLPEDEPQAATGHRAGVASVVDPATGMPVAADPSTGMPVAGAPAGSAGVAQGAGAAGVPGAAGGAVPAPGAPPPPGATPAPAPAVPGVAPPPGAPPPPKGPKGSIPKAPPKKGAKGGAKGKGPNVQWWKGGKPSVPLRVFHWEKVMVNDEKAEGTIWNQVHYGVDCTFDLEDFVDKFQAKQAKKGDREKKVVVQKTEMMDSKKFQNISIMLHKMPEVELIKKGLDTLDTEILSRDCLEAIKAQIPNEEEEEMFVAKIDEKNAKGEEWEKPELYYKMIVDYNSGMFRKRAESWLFSLDWDEVVVNIVKPLNKLIVAINAVLQSDSLPYVMGVLLGFGNMMNAGTAKGNAGGFSPKTLTQLEAARDKSGKVNLLQHLVHTVKKQRSDALGLPEELKTTLNNIQSIKYDDLDKAFRDAEDALKKFGTQYKSVVTHIEKQGKMDSDPYVTKMEVFKSAADAELQKMQEQYNACKDQFLEILSMWSAPKKVKEKPQPEDFFGSLTPFLERFKMECDVIAKEEKSRTKHRPGDRIGKPSAGIDEVVGDIQQNMVSS